MKKFIFLVLTVVLFVSSTNKDVKITVAVAANAQYAMEEIKSNYEKETGVKVELIKGASGKLTAQIREGAPYDIFVSADTSYPNTLYREGMTTGASKIYGYGTLVLWTTKDIDLLNVNVVALPEVKKLAIGNPKLAPYGAAAVQVLNYYKLYTKVEPKLVYGESLSQVSQYVTSGAAEMGFTAKSIMLSKEMQGKGKWMELNKKSYTPIAQAAVEIKRADGSQQEETDKFFNYLYSAKTKGIWKKYGYIVP